MADIYVRPYDDRGRKPKRLVPVLVLLVLAGIIAWWLFFRKESPEESELQPVSAVEIAETAPVTVSSPASVPSSSESSSIDAQRLFRRAQAELGSGNLMKASELLENVINGTSNAVLRNNALRVQGRINIDLFFSEVPTPQKSSYIVQPGDSLDRIARRNHTTIELLRKLNSIKGDLIYPGERLTVPTAPFVVKVDKSDCYLDLFMDGKRMKRYPIGVGRHGKTPTGTFFTVVHQEKPDWTPPTGGIIPYGDPRNVLGSRWMSFQDESRPELKGFGIHGTSERDSIGKETSNGCIRMLNEDVEELFLLIPRGTQIIINE